MAPPPSRTIQDLPAEVSLSIINLLDPVSNICFALTSTAHYRLVKAFRGPLKNLQPAFKGYRHINRTGTRPHEIFAGFLWSWLGDRCVYCGIKEVLVQDWNSQTRIWTYNRHRCRGWLEQFRHYGRHKRKHEEWMFEHAQSVDMQSILMSRLHHRHQTGVSIEFRRAMEEWMER